jgi:hypothetical protein
MLVYQSRFLTRGEVWFDDEPDDTSVDWVLYRQRPSPVPRARCKYFYTVLIDLAKSPAQLLADVDGKTVRKIADAEKLDHIRWERCEANNPKTMDAVERMWNEFAAARKSTPLDRAWLDKIIEAGALELSAAKDAAGNVLTYHLTYAGKKRAQDLIVVSPHTPVPNVTLRNRINRANCLGHWQTMLNLKERGFCHYDFGGWYRGTTDLQLLGMNAFKQSFGGQVVRGFECKEIRTLKGWFVLMVAKMFKQAGTFGANGGVKTTQPSKPEGDVPATAKSCEISPAF